MAGKNSANSAPKKGKPRRDWKPAFLAALASDGSVKTASLAAGIDRQTAYNHRQKDEQFAAGWDSAVEEAVEAMEAEAFRRAVKGTEKPVFHQGVECGRIREFSDTLLIFMIKAGKPAKYREAKADVNINVTEERLAADPVTAEATLAFAAGLAKSKRSK